MKLDGTNTLLQSGKGACLPTFSFPSGKQPVDRREKKVAIAKGRLQEPQLMKRFVGGIATQVENEVHDLSTGKDRSPLLDAPCCCKDFDCRRDRAIF
jgi:hypothetical protein